MPVRREFQRFPTPTPTTSCYLLAWLWGPAIDQLGFVTKTEQDLRKLLWKLHFQQGSRIQIHSLPADGEVKMRPGGSPAAAAEANNLPGINFVACLPDSAFQELYLPVSSDPKITYVQVASENDGVGVCMGAWLGGMKPALLVENTGFTLGTYALLRGPMAFGVPMLLLISHRGELGDERWFSVPFGWGTKPLLDSMRITHRSVEKTEEVSAAISNAVKSMNSMQAPVAILFSGEILF